jgi:uncharacterized protein YdhG (YjbR/CyaY superfamily)
MSVAMKINEELKGIELYFASKPSEEVRKMLKTNSFRWSSFKGCWYAKQSEKAFKVANEITGEVKEEVKEATKEVTVKKENVKTSMSLWEATQWTKLEVSQEIKDQENKLIAKEIKAHVKKRFPQVKFSVSCKGWNSIYLNIVSSPFEEGSLYLNAIREYCKKLVNAYHHCYEASDWYTDYAGSYNFYGNVEIHWDYKQTEVTEAN